MIFRAVFWIGLVALLMPHEPDLGLGHPGAGTSQASPSIVLSAASGLSRMGQDCGSACAGGLGFLTGAGTGLIERIGLNPDGTIARGLAGVKAQIDADIQARAQKLG
jgi:hypothetical protein